MLEQKSPCINNVVYYIIMKYIFMKTSKDIKSAKNDITVYKK